MNRIVVVGLCAVSCLAAFVVGCLIGNVASSKTKGFGYVLVRERAASAATSRPSSVRAANLRDVLDIWAILAAADLQMDAEVKRRGVLFRLSEGMLMRTYAPERLAPVFRGALDARGLSIVDYFRVEKSLIGCLQRWSNEPGVSYYLMRMSIRSSSIDVLEDRMGTGKFVISEKDCEELKKELLESVGKDYQRLADFDDAVLFGLFSKGKTSR